MRPGGMYIDYITGFQIFTTLTCMHTACNRANGNKSFSRFDPAIFAIEVIGQYAKLYQLSMSSCKNLLHALWLVFHSICKLRRWEVRVHTEQVLRQSQYHSQAIIKHAACTALIYQVKVAL